MTLEADRGQRWRKDEPASRFASASIVSVLVHGVALAGILLWLDRTPPPEPSPDQGVEIIWEQDASQAVSEPEPTEPPGTPPRVEAPESPEAAEPPPPPPTVAAAPPPPSPPAPTALAPPLPPLPPLDIAPVDLPAPDLAVAPPPPAHPEEGREAAAPPPVEAPPVPPQELQLAATPPPPEPPPPEPPLPEPPPPEPPRQQVQPRPRTPPRPPARQPPSQAAEAANPGAPQMAAGIGQALGAVVPPAPDTRFQNVAPGYPEAARLRGEQGSVGLALSIDAEGRVTQVEVASSSGSPMLDAAARRAVMEWRFRPAQRDGVPMPGTIRTSVHFRLQ